MTSVIIGSGVTSIDRMAFDKCTALESITLPNNVVSIGVYAFTACGSLTSITVSKENQQYHSDGNCLIETATKTLVLGCRNSIIPNDGSVTAIGRDAFLGCTGLTSIVIPNSITSIWSSAFESCSNLTSVTIGSGVTYIGEGAFYASVFENSCLTKVFYKGDKSEWENISIGKYNSALTSATLYYYSASEPALTSDGADYNGNYWHYDVDGITPVIWKKEN